MAEAALHASGMHTSFFKCSTDNTTILWCKALHFPAQILVLWNPVHQHRNQVHVYCLSDSLLTQISDHFDQSQGEQDLALHASRPHRSARLFQRSFPVKSPELPCVWRQLQFVCLFFFPSILMSFTASCHP